MPSFLIPIIVGVAVVVALMVLFKLMWRVAEPNEAMIISGFKDRGPANTPESVGFSIVTGKGRLVIPGVQTVRRLKLNLHEADLQVQCVTQQGIPVIVKGVVIFKIADDFASIANAARRFLGQQDVMDNQVHNVFAGHLRSIIGGMTVEELIRDREKLETDTRTASGIEMQKLGFLLDSLKIQEIDDPSGYIQNLAKPHIAQVQKDARIAEATNNREAAQQEAVASAEIAEAQRSSAIKQAGYTAEVQHAQATASQSGPLAQAQAKQAVVQQETEVAKLEAERTERQLDADVRKPADAAQYKQIKEAEGDRQATILAAEAEGERIQRVGAAEGAAIASKGEAEGKALKARADGLAANQEAVIGQQLAEKVPEIVRAAAGAFEHVGNLTVLNGAQGLMEALNSVVAESLASLGTIRSALNDNGHGAPEETPQIERVKAAS